MSLGYTDTPFIHDQVWRVHDAERPQPRIITPGDASTKAAVSPPSDAVVLFDGSNMDEWESIKDSSASPWELTSDKAMRVVPKTGNIRTKRQFGDVQLHVEWAAPTEIKGEGQGRGNSGVFLMGRYEIQVLDSYDNPSYADGLATAVYGQYPPLVNACCKPGEWHIYDIIWTAPRFSCGQLVAPATVTVLHNGVVTHNHRILQGPTEHRDTTRYDPHPETGPIMLQDHGDLVQFRNIWVRDI
ncbi:MAG: DUF1080 domain-containing protein [Planctomycetota bacterium]|jgi:hypothetical protein|nr:DUF1080 domain-containing protein [Planctomycetota bacterium]